MKELSPCVTSAKHALPEEVSAWEFARHLFEMHPEYTHGKVAPYISGIDLKFQGEKKNINDWLEMISQKYPKEELLHTRLVLLGLCQVDSTLNALIPKEILSILENEIRFC